MNKIYAFVVLITALCWLEIYKIEVADTIDEPGKFKFNLVFFRVARYAVSLRTKF